MSVVAPLAGAWIEINSRVLVDVSASVAPLAGAWIEILAEAIFDSLASVAPLAGAWIEIQNSRVRQTARTTSLPSRERGLKFFQFEIAINQLESLPSRERGLKCRLVG